MEYNEDVRAGDVRGPYLHYGGQLILDPCAGGTQEKEDMSYPSALLKYTLDNPCVIDTIDIRHDSCASTIGDYLKIDCAGKYDVIITNPPFSCALEIIQKALADVKDGGIVVMLLRLNFFGSQARQDWLQKNMPDYCYVHSKRMNFTGKGTDSVEYMHAVWRKTKYGSPKFTALRII